MSPFAARLTVFLILPAACLWAKWQEAALIRHGVPLPESLLKDARKIGVRHPERVRLQVVPLIPGGMPPWLGRIMAPLGPCSPLTSGMSLRYGIFIRSDCCDDRRLVRHELVHTRQYEQLGGIWPFLNAYLYECLAAPGYPFGRLEQEAHRCSWS